MTVNWFDIGAIDDIPQRGARCVRTPQGKIGVFRTHDGRIFAIEDHCPHKGGPLSQGIVHDAAVTCPLHNWVISLASGLAQGADSGQVKTYRLKQEAGRVLLDGSVLAPVSAA